MLLANLFGATCFLFGGLDDGSTFGLSLVWCVFFIPLSFLSGVFGMNFNKSLPGQESASAFTIFVAACCVLGLGMLGLFWWRKWL